MDLDEEIILSNIQFKKRKYMYKNAVIMSIPLVGLDRESMESQVIHGY